MNTIELTIVTTHGCGNPVIQELMEVERYLSAGVRSQMTLEIRCLHLEGGDLDFGVLVNRHLTGIRSLPELVDYLHLMATGILAA